MTRPTGPLLFLLTLAACSGAACSGASTPRPDAGALDAGHPDAGLSDAGPGDGGVFEGCEGLAHDAVLGTAEVGAAYRVVDFTPLPVASPLPVALVAESLPDGGSGPVVYGHAADGRVHRLGVWPRLAAPGAANVAFEAVAPADRALQVAIVPRLVETHGHLLAAYRTPHAGAVVGGGVSLFDTATPAGGTRWLSAPGVAATLGLGSFFLVGAESLGGASGGLGVYAATVDGETPRAGLVAAYPRVEADAVRPGLFAVTSNGVVAMGHYVDGAARHSVRIPEPSRVAGAPPELGVPVTVLSASDGARCTRVTQLVPLAGAQSLGVGLRDGRGQRLVRLAPR